MAGDSRVSSITRNRFCGIISWSLGRSYASMEWFVSIQNLPYSDQLTILFIFTAAQFIAILAQNFLLIVGAVCVALTFYFRKTLATESIHYIFMLVNLPSANWIFPYFVVDGWGLTCACSLIVIICTMAHLASVASSIVVYKDWIVIIADGDTQQLASKVNFRF